MLARAVDSQSGGARGFEPRPLLAKQVLYQLSYGPVDWVRQLRCHENKQKLNCALPISIFDAFDFFRYEGLSSVRLTSSR